MYKILINDGIHPDGLELLRDAGYDCDTDKVPQDELMDRLPEYDVITVRSATKVREDVIANCPKLKVIARGGVGLDNIDVDFAKSKGIAVVNTPAASSESVAELAFAHMFSLARFLYQSNRAMPHRGDTEFKALKKAYSKGIQLRGRTLGIIGFGRIGQETARIGVALGMNVLPVDLHIDEADISVNVFDNDSVGINLKLKTVGMDEMLAQADFVSLHVPSVSRPIIGADEFAKMKDGAIIVNCARGGVIDEDALLAALESGKIAAAGLDVFENEPTPRRELLEHDRISLTPHIGASTGAAQRNIGTEMAEKIIAHLEK